MKRKKLLTKLLIPLLAVFIALAAVLAVTPTLARYIRGTNGLPNEFESIGSKNPSVNNGELDKDGKLKNVTFNVGNTGYPVYVRVMVIVTWKNAEEGDILYIQPQPKLPEADTEADYEVTYNTSEWMLLGGYYYFIGSDSINENNPDYLNGVVKSGKTTSALVTELVQLKSLESPFDDYKLDVEFIVQTVQAVGYTDDDKLTACEDAWGLPHGTLAPKTDSDIEDDTNNG